ncbi:MAG: YchJ family metal-binding protein [Oligoflexia bacterium]|nr:YchJ family metal-binding protein [Oligoflexia bacterium]
MTSSVCPCTSGKEFELCCGPILSGKKKATTAEELLRARYTAFTQGNVDFVLNTHHSRTRDEIKREEIEDWSKNSEWKGLQIVHVEGGKPEDEKGTLSFCARYVAEGKLQEHWEQSYFEKENGEWRFLDAKGIHLGTYQRTEPKIGRNDSCPCGSGKKYKKCCAA